MTKMAQSNTVMHRHEKALGVLGMILAYFGGKVEVWLEHDFGKLKGFRLGQGIWIFVFQLTWALVRTDSGKND